MHSANLIREARRRANMTQHELAQRAGTTQSAIARWERGGSVPSLETLQRVIAAAGFDLHISVTPIDTDHERLITAALARTPQERLEDLLTNLDVEDQLHAATRVA